MENEVSQQIAESIEYITETYGEDKEPEEVPAVTCHGGLSLKSMGGGIHG